MHQRSLLVCLAVLCLTMAGTASAQPPAAFHFIAPLEGEQEVPPVETTAAGLAQLQLNDDDATLHFKLLVAHIEGVTQAHVHCGAEGVNGPVVIFLFGFDPAGVSVNGIIAEGTITDADVIARPDSAACPGGVAGFDDLIAKMRRAATYVNVHTLAHPGGEIRGQVMAAGPRAR